jgi:hypothetical protein
LELISSFSGTKKLSKKEIIIFDFNREIDEPLLKKIKTLGAEHEKQLKLWAEEFGVLSQSNISNVKMSKSKLSA